MAQLVAALITVHGMFFLFRKEGQQAMNRDEGSYQLSHAYDRFLDTLSWPVVFPFRKEGQQAMNHDEP